MNKIPADELMHISVVVKDIKASAKKYARVYGIAEWKVVNHGKDRLSNTSTHGYQTAQEFATATGIARTDHGPVAFRLIEPRAGWTTYQEFLLTRGEGIHSVCTAIINPNRAAELKTWLAGEGVEVAQSYRLDQEVEHLHLDTRKTLGGFYLELLVTDGEYRQPDPDEVWNLQNEIPADGGLLPLGTFEMHFGVVVRDLMETTRNWSRLFGVTTWNYMNWHKGPGSLEEPFYLGKPVDHAYFTTLYNITPLLGFEIIQPTFGPSHYKEEFSDKFGEGIHHLNASLIADPTTWPDVEKRLQEYGAPVVMGGGVGGGFARFFYLDTREALGYVTEAITPDVNWGRGPQGLQVALSADMSARVEG